MKTITPQVDRLHIARAYMDSHYDAPITLERISSEAGFSPYISSACFAPLTAARRINT